MQNAFVILKVFHFTELEKLCGFLLNPDLIQKLQLLKQKA